MKITDTQPHVLSNFIRLLPHDRLIETRPGRTLMESLMNKSIFLRSDCGGKGVCKKCQVK
ncbi:MAG: hypothetical protein JRC91_11365, partial [Deltaproteobacteria bacterium]|nr:hypothetical protein [Deltaproteobacteria bacterium]